MTFEEKRTLIKESVIAGGVNKDLVSYNEYFMPNELPAAIITIRNETGIKGTFKQYTESSFDFEIFLIVKLKGVEDPDLELYNLKEAVRAAYKRKLHKDFPRVEYYPTKLKALDVKVAKIYTYKGGAA